MVDMKMNQSNTIRVGLVGAGRVAQHYKKILELNEISNFTIVGVCDIKFDAADFLAQHWGCPSFDDLKTMIDALKPNLILVLTPSGLHFEHSKISLLAGCHVLVEKPVTMIPSDARELVEIAKAQSLMIGVAFQNRFNPAISLLKDALDAKRFGKITLATIRLRWCRYQDYYNDGWHGTWLQDGGVINQQAIHHVDALNWLLGPVESVCATISNSINKLEAEDTMVSVLRFTSGALGTIEATTAARPRDFEASLSVVGEKGIAVIGGIALNKIETWEFIDPLPGDANAPELFSREVPNGYGLSHVLLLKETFDRLRKGSIIAPVPVETCISTGELIHSLYRSHENKGWVNLSDQLNSIKLGFVRDHE
jgi:UDP-N-acetyl-2-amino-2-deoxyglucuronate dehydrogenase